MDSFDLFLKLDKLNPTEKQLQEYMERKANIYPLPLFVQLPDKTYTIVRKLYETMDVKGITTERGIFLFEHITPDKDKSYCYSDILLLAQQIHQKARPLTYDDAYGDGEGNNIADLIDQDSPLYMTVNMLIQKRGIKPFGTEWNYFENEDPEQTNIICTDICAKTETLAICYADNIPLFIPISELGYDFKVVSKEPRQGRYGLDVGVGVDGCDFPPALNAQEGCKFPCSLFLRNSKEGYFVSKDMVADCTVEGIVLQDTIIMRQTINPSEIDKDEPTIGDVVELAKQVHPDAQPLYFSGFPSGGGIITLLLIDRERYITTAELLKMHYNITMPDINTSLYFIGGDYPQINCVNQIYVGWWTGGARIGCVEEMLVAIPREKVEGYH